MANVTVTKNNCKVESLYQWDTKQVLEVYGLSLSVLPEVHFAFGSMRTAEVCQPTMDRAGVIRVEIPDKLLEKSGTLYAYICIKEGKTFSTLKKITLPVLPRPEPEDEDEEDEQNA